MLRTWRLAMMVTVACAAAAYGFGEAAAQIQLVPSGRPAQTTPAPQRQAPAQPRADRPGEQRPAGERRRRGQQRQPAAEAAADPAAAGPSPFPQRLNQATIRTRFFNGQPINARALGGGLFTLVFHTDGRMERTGANGEVRTGRWRFLGDSYCSRWDPTATPAAAQPQPSSRPAPSPPRRSSVQGARQPAQRPAPETCHTVVQEGTTVRVVRNTRAVATWTHEGTPPPP